MTVYHDRITQDISRTVYIDNESLDVAMIASITLNVNCFYHSYISYCLNCIMYRLC